MFLLQVLIVWLLEVFVSSPNLCLSSSSESKTSAQEILVVVSLQESSLVVVPLQESSLVVVSLQESSLVAVPLEESSFAVVVSLQKFVVVKQSEEIVVDGCSHDIIVAGLDNEIAEDVRVPELVDGMLIAIFVLALLPKDLVAGADKRLWETEDRVVWSPVVSVMMAAMAAFGSS